MPTGPRSVRGWAEACHCVVVLGLGCIRRTRVEFSELHFLGCRVVSHSNGNRPPAEESGSFSAVVALIIGVTACSSSVIFIKASSVPPILLSGYRLLVAAIVLAPLFIRDWRRLDGQWPLSGLRRTLLPAAMLAVHLITWTIGARWTAAANASLIVNMVPVAMPVLLYLTIREKVSGRELVGTAVAVGGIFILCGGEYVAGRDTLWGDLICFGSMILFTWYLALARRNRDFPSLWLYLVPLYGLGALFCFSAAAVAGDLLMVFPTREYLLLLALGIIPTVMGHSLLNRAMTHLRGQVVSVVNVGQFISAGMMAFLLFGEQPATVFYLAALLVMAGAIIIIRAEPRAAVTRAPSRS